MTTTPTNATERKPEVLTERKLEVLWRVIASMQREGRGSEWLLIHAAVEAWLAI